MKNVGIIVCSLIVVVSFAGCASRKYYQVYSFDGKKTIEVRKGASIAVISPNNTKINYDIADRITKQIEEKGFLRAMSQEKIQKAIPEYPQNIIFFELDSDSENREKPYISDDLKLILDQYQKKLKVDYILVIWNESLETITYHPNNNRLYIMPVFDRLIEYPSGKIVSYSCFQQYRMWYPKSLLGKYEDEAVIDQMISDLAEGLMKRFHVAAGFIPYVPDKAPEKGCCIF